MKKTRLFGMLALAVALVFGVASCAQDSKPSGQDVADALKDGDDLSGTWKLTDAYAYVWSDSNVPLFSYEAEYEGPEKVAKSGMLPFELDSNLSFTLTKENQKENLERISKMLEATEKEAEEVDDGDFDGYFIVNNDLDEVYFYMYMSGSESEFGIEVSMEQEIDLTFTKQK